MRTYDVIVVGKGNAALCAALGLVPLALAMGEPGSELLAPLAIATTLGLTQGLKVFDQVQAMTRGGPYGATETLSTVIYTETFANANFGYGAALSLVFTILVLAAAAFQLFITRDRSGR